MNDARSWAEGWLTNLVAHGVPNAPGLSRTLLLHGRQWSLLAIGEVHGQRRELRRPVAAGIPKNGRYGVVYERPWQGRDAVWIEVAEYHHGRFGERLAMVQPVRREEAGEMVADGAPVAVDDRQVSPTPRPSVPAWLRGDRLAAPAWLCGNRWAMVAAALVGVLLLGLLSAVSLTRDDGAPVAIAAPDPVTGGPAPDPATAAPAPDPAPAVGPAPGLVAAPPPAAGPAPDAAPAPAPDDAAPPPAPAAPPPVPAEPAPARPDPARSEGDLGLAEPISQPPCDGAYGVFVVSATRPEAYQREIGDALARYPGSRYLSAHRTCPSLRGYVAGGVEVYAVYFGPYPTMRQACATRARVGDGSYVRRLDQGGPDRSFRC